MIIYTMNLMKPNLMIFIWDPLVDHSSVVLLNSTKSTMSAVSTVSSFHTERLPYSSKYLVTTKNPSRKDICRTRDHSGIINRLLSDTSYTRYQRQAGPWVENKFIYSVSRIGLEFALWVLGWVFYSCYGIMYTYLM